MSATRKRRVTATISFDVGEDYLDVELIGGPNSGDLSILTLVIDQLEADGPYGSVCARETVAIESIREERSLS
jgi:hypothetical protein